MSDIVTRLRQTRANMIGTDDEQHYWDCHDAAREIERLREAIRRLADQDATLSVQGGNVIVDMDQPCPYVTGKTTRYCTLTPFTITAAEREAIERAIETLDGWQKTGGYHSAIEDDAATLRGLLERLGAANSGEDRRSGGGE